MAGIQSCLSAEAFLTWQKMAICSAATRQLLSERSSVEFINLSRAPLLHKRAATINYADARTVREPLGGALHFIKRAMRKSSRESGSGLTTIAV
jgi:hypothetical protein